MALLIRPGTVVGIIVAPTVWLGYFVLTFLVSEVSCNRGWHTAGAQSEFIHHGILTAIALATFALLAFASWESWRYLRTARREPEPEGARTQEREIFLAEAGLFLCGISLLGTLWGTINIFVFRTCAG